MKKHSLFIGIDMSKKWFDAALTVNGEQPQMKHKRFDNTPKGFTKLFSWIKNQAKLAGAGGQWLFCMEHTGVYTLPLCAYLEDQELDYVLESGLRIKRSLGIRRGKSDKADSKDIAEYVYTRSKSLKINKIQAVDLVRLKDLLSFRSRLVKQRTMLKSSSKEYKAFKPEQYLSEMIIADSRDLIGVLNEKIKKVEKELKRIVDENEELKKLYKLVASVKGVGFIISITMLVYTNGFKAFDNARKFATYISIAPFAKTSGTSTNIAAKISQLGYKKIKALISNAVATAIQYDKGLKAYYERKIEQGKNKYSVQNAVKNKIIHRVFAVVKRGTPYVDLHNYT